MIGTIVYLLSLTLIALAALGLGRPVIRALIARDEQDEVAIALWSAAVGMVLAGTLLTALGFVGLLYGWLIRLLTVALAPFGLLTLIELARLARLRKAGWLHAHEESPSRESNAPPPWLVGGCRWAAAMVMLATLTSALAPPTAGDALCYHLELAKRFLIEHRLVDLPFDDNATYPLIVEMWYLWGLALGGGVPAQLVHWFIGLLFAGGTFALGSTIVGRGWATVAATFALLAPGINNQMTAPLNDLALATFTTLALAAWWRAAIDDRPSGWYAMAGVMFGGALATKYTALVFLAAWSIAAAVILYRQIARRKVMLRGMATAAVIAVSMAGPWYVRSMWLRGDPIYPYLSTRVEGAAPKADKRPLGVNLLAAMTAPWDVTMSPQRVGGRSHQLGPLFLAVLPTLVIARRLRGVATLLIVASAFGLLWFVLRHNVRFLQPVAPLLAVPMAWAISEWRRWPVVPQRIATLSTVGLALVCLAIPVRRGVKLLPVAVGIESRDDYLRRVEPTYGTALAMRALLTTDACVLSQEQRAFYLPGRITRESIYRRETQFDQATDAELLDHLRHAGFTHLLLAEADNDADITFDETLGRRVAAAVAMNAETSPRCLDEQTFVDEHGGRRRYRLLEL